MTIQINYKNLVYVKKCLNSTFEWNLGIILSYNYIITIQIHKLVFIYKQINK